VPDPLPLPDDLIQLQRERIAADEAVGEYVAEVSARRRELYPLEDQSLERASWEPEEDAELIRLREVRAEAASAVRRHPALQDPATLWQAWDASVRAARGE
jgi:hypothetical protein